jgi:hypothetical protein
MQFICHLTITYTTISSPVISFAVSVYFTQLCISSITVNKKTICQTLSFDNNRFSFFSIAKDVETTSYYSLILLNFRGTALLTGWLLLAILATMMIPAQTFMRSAGKFEVILIYHPIFLPAI